MRFSNSFDDIGSEVISNHSKVLYSRSQNVCKFLTAFLCVTFLEGLIVQVQFDLEGYVAGYVLSIGFFNFTLSNSRLEDSRDIKHSYDVVVTFRNEHSVRLKYEFFITCGFYYS